MNCSEVGISVPVDVEAAQYWYTRAAAGHNQDAKDRLAALAASASSRMSRTDHESHIDTRLVRKRTQAKNRSDQRQQQQQQQPVGSQFGQAPPGGRPGAYPDSSVKRRDTIRQVEMAAAIGGGRERGGGGRGNGQGRGEGSDGSHGSHGGRTGATAAQQIKQQYAAQAEAVRRPSPQGPRPGPGGQGVSPGPGRNSSAVRTQAQAQAQANRPAEQQTFADLGIKTTKAKKDDCIVSCKLVLATRTGRVARLTSATGVVIGDVRQGEGANWSRDGAQSNQRKLEEECMRLNRNK